MISKITLMRIRNFLVSNFFVNINAIVYKNTYILTENNVLTYYLLKLIPLFIFKILNYFTNVQFIYSYDNIYNITGFKNYHIIPYLFEFKFYDVELINKNKLINFINDDIKCNDTKCEVLCITSTIKYYNSNIPFNYILLKNKILNSKHFKIKYLNINNEMIDKKLFINNYINKYIYDLFKN